MLYYWKKNPILLSANEEKDYYKCLFYFSKCISTIKNIHSPIGMYGILELWKQTAVAKMKTLILCVYYILGRGRQMKIL